PHGHARSASPSDSPHPPTPYPTADHERRSLLHDAFVSPATAGTRLLHPYPRDDERTARPPAHLEPILEQLLCGATDLTASRRLGLSPRTFSRRVSELLEYLGVATRFQAGAEAYNRGWITIQPGG
ncbi:hypothetical protein NMN56_021930, partial [Streptomyces iconiensis]|nr:hypothetical protein [Streptomyces iconiensis]